MRWFSLQKSLIFFLILAAKPPVYAQVSGVHFEHISLEQGLYHADVNAIYQDRLGFLWIGTIEALQRYDGYTFVTYRNDPADTNSLSNNDVTDICEDSHGNLWIGTIAGLNLFDRDRKIFRRFFYSSTTENGLPIHVIYPDNRGRIWIGTSRGLYVLAPGSGSHESPRGSPTANGRHAGQAEQDQLRFMHYVHDPENPNSLSHNEIHAIYEDHTGNLWVGTEVGLNRLVFPNKAVRESGKAGYLNEAATFIRYLHDPRNPKSLSHNDVRAIYEDKKHRLWVGTDGGGLNQWNPAEQEFILYQYDSGDPSSLSNDKIRVIYEDRQGVLWVGTFGGGLNRFDPKTEQFFAYTRNPLDPSNLSSNVVWEICEDRSGILWFGTSGGGISKFDRRRQKFKHYTEAPGKPDGLSNHYVKAIYEDRSGHIWIGTGNGLNRFDSEKGEFTQYKHDPNDPNSLSHDIVFSIHEDHLRHLWVGTLNGLNRFDRENGRFTRYYHNPAKPNSLGNDKVTALLEDSFGILWVGTAAGLDRFDRKTQTFMHFRHDPSDSSSLSYNYVRVIYEDSRRNLWIGTGWETPEGGLNLFDRQTGRFRRYLHDPTIRNSLSNSNIVTLYEDTLNDGYTLWIGTANGLNKFDPERNVFTHYTEKDGLPNNYIRGIVGDERGKLWISTNHGFARFDPEAEAFLTYDISDGLQSLSFNYNACLKDSKGRIYFGGVNGFNVFHPDSLQTNRIAPPIVLTSFKVFDKPFKLDQSISRIKKIELSYKQNFFSLEFAALDYTAPEKNQYAYKLEGFDKDWIYSGNRRYANYTNLGGGDYVFRVKGSNNDGVWNEEGASVRIKIIPPFWETWWFRIVVLLSVVGLATAFHRYRIAKLKEVERVRAHIAADLHDEIASSLASVRLYSEVIQRQKIPEETKNLVGRIRNLSQQVMEGIGQIIWSVDPRHDALSDLMEYMRQQANQLCTAAGLSLRLRFPAEVKPFTLTPEQRRTIYLIFKEGLNNIIRHSRCTQVELTCKQEKNVFEFVLQDNGRGFDVSCKNNGHGLGNMQQRARAVGANLEIRSEPEKGTTIAFRMKMT